MSVAPLAAVCCVLQLLPAGQRELEVRGVDTQSEAYQVALSYMTRLSIEDYQDPQMFARLAAAFDRSEDDFLNDFGYLMGVMPELSI